MIIVDFL